MSYHSSGSDRVSSYNPKARKTDSFYKDSRNIGLNAERMLEKAGVKPTEEFKETGNDLGLIRGASSRIVMINQ